MIEMFFGIMLVCSQEDPGQCAHVIGPMFGTERECMVDLMTNGLAYVSQTYGNVHIATGTCVEANMQGEPA